MLALACAAFTQKPKPVPTKPAPAPAQAPFVNPYTADELRNKQAVIETAAGTIVLDLLADAAPNHVAHFIKTARDGGYDGTLFHRVIKHGIIQGGDPLSKDPASQGSLWHRRAEPAEAGDQRREAHARGGLRGPRSRTVPTAPARSSSSASPISQRSTASTRSLRGSPRASSSRRKFRRPPPTTRARRSSRIAMTRVTIRDKPAPTAEPFSTETVADLAQYRAVLETSLGDITIEFTPDKAPEHVRNFLRLASARACTTAPAGIASSKDSSCRPATCRRAGNR